jgi:hypothetical protein
MKNLAWTALTLSLMFVVTCLMDLITRLHEVSCLVVTVGYSNHDQPAQDMW